MTKDQTSQSPISSRKATITALLLYVLVALVMTWPLLTNLTSEFAGGRGDQLVHRWTFWWVKEALLTSQNPFYTTMLYYPEGTSLLSHNIAWLNIAFWLPVQTAVGAITAYNLMFLTIYTLNGFAMFLLAREMIQEAWPAFLAGLIVATWPYLLSHYDHPNMILLFPLPLALLYLGRLLRGQRWRDVGFTAVFIALLGVGRWQLLLMSLPLLVGSGLFFFWRTPAAPSKAMMGKLLAAGGLTILLMLPLALPLIQSQLQEEPTGVAIYEPDNGRTDLLAYVLSPNLYQRWSGEPYSNIAASVDYIPFIGFLTLVLVLIGLSKRWSQGWFWLLMAGLYIVLALGSALAINQQLYLDGFMPYRLLEGTLVGDFIRRPHRFNIMLAVPVGMMAGLGTAVLLNWKPLQQSHWRQATAVVLISLLTIASTKTTIPFTSTPHMMPAWYDTLPTEETFGLLELPSYDRTFDKYYMAYQTQHGKPIAAGHISRLPAAARQNLAENTPWFLYAIEHDNFPDFSVTAVGQALHQLQQQNIRYLILHKPFLSGSLPDLWQDWLTIHPIYEDDELIVYRTNIVAGEDFEFTQPLTEEIGLIQSSFAPEAANQAGVIKVDARFASTAVPADDYQLCLTLHANETNTTSHCQPISANYPTSQWPANEIIRGSYLVPVSEEVPSGDFQLELGLLNSNGQLTGQTAVLGPITIHPFSPENETHLVWQNDMELLGYNQRQTDDNLLLEPFWRSPQSLDNSYKLFIHIVQPDTNEIVVQSDIIPRNWQYPTDIWEPNEVIRDEIIIPLADLPNGDYDIWFGWYDSITNEPLRSVDGTERHLLGQFTK